MACSSCFAHYNWLLANESPCFVFSDPSMTTLQEMISTDATTQQCPADFSMAPASWTTDTFTADCAGHYRLCYTLKAGDPSNPKPTDCTVVQSCAEGDDTLASMAQTWPSLPGWLVDGAQLACAQQFSDSGGYGEATATGNPTGCGAVSVVLGRVTYCALSCNSPNPPASCATCVAGGQLQK